MSDQRRNGISWTDETWNPLRGCSKVSPGCKNCYAETMAARFAGPGQPYEGTIDRGRWNGQIRLVPEKLAEPLRWCRPRRIFVNSMSDLFHPGVPFEYIAAVFGVMAAAPQHVFQVLTKRPDRAAEFLAWVVKQDAATLGRVNLRRAFPEPMTPGRLECCMQALLHEARHHPLGISGPLHRDRAADPAGPWPLPNVWLGVSVEDQTTADERIPHLLQCPASVRWVSYEPALGPVDFERWIIEPMYCAACGSEQIVYDTNPHGLAVTHTCIMGAGQTGEPGAERCVDCGSLDVVMPGALDWVVIGGESGPHARPFDVAWARSTIAQCRAAGLACFVKQMGARPRVAEASRLAALWAAMPGGRVDDCGGIHLRDRAGADPAEWPEDLRVREWPAAKEGEK